MSIPTNELLLALRSPTSGWLAAVVCALDEAVQDPSFSEHHRNLLRQLIDVKSIPAQVATAANARLGQFEASINEMNEALFEEITASASTPAFNARPKLTLVGSSVAA